MRKSISSLSSSFRTRLAGALLSGVLALTGCGAGEADGEVEAQSQALTSPPRQVYFSTMTINNCNEVGSCDWLLECDLGDGQSFTLVNNFEADTRDTIRINRRVTDMEGTRYVGCVAYEYDGGIGAGWDLVGHAEVQATRAGLFSLRMRNGEGDVTVRVQID